MDVNELRRLLQSGAISEDDLQNMTLSGSSQPNALAQALQPMPQPRYDIAPMQQNTMRVENGPDAGKVTNLDFRGAQPQNYVGNQQTGHVTSLDDAVNRFAAERAAPRTMQVIGTGNGTTVQLGSQAAPQQVNIDSSRPPLDTMGGRAFYSKDEPGVAYVMGPDGPKAKILLGYDMQGSMALNRYNLNAEKDRADIAHTQEQVAASQQARNTKEGLPGYGVPQSLLDKQFGKAPEGKRWTMDGTLEDIPGGSGKPLTESQGKAAGLATRAQAAHDILTNFEAQGVTTPSIIKQGVESVPLVGGALAMGANKAGIPSTAQNQVEQAQRDFVNAALRVESGASISQGEFDNARKQYFPQPGDSPEVIKQKQQGREREINSLAIQSGPGASNIRPMTGGADKARAIFDAKKAIAAGAPRAAVMARLQAAGINDRI